MINKFNVGLMVFIILWIVALGLNIKEISQLKEENDYLKTQLATFEKEAVEEAIILPTETTTPIISDKFENVNIVVTNKINHNQNYDIGMRHDFVEIQLSIANNFEKDIKGINGVLHVKDMFDVEIVSLEWDLTESNLPIKETVTITGKGVDMVTRATRSNSKLWNAPYENLIFEYECKQIIFIDNSILK